jgi:hypothetical protein
VNAAPGSGGAAADRRSAAAARGSGGAAPGSGGAAAARRGAAAAQGGGGAAADRRGGAAAAETALLVPVGRPGGETALVVVAAVALQALVWAFLIWLLRPSGPWYHFFDVSDIFYYIGFAQKVSQGLRVYKDFAFEYPPLALPLLALLPHADPAAYADWFAAEMIVLCSAAAALTGATAAALWRGLGRPLAAAAAYAVAVLAAGAITANRYDVAVALTLAACLFFLARRHPAAAGGALGLGVALKLTPGMLLPLVLIVAETRRRMLWALAAFLVFAALPFLPFLDRFHGLTYVITYNTQRPMQIESVPGTPYLIAGALGRWGISTGSSFGSQSLGGPGSVVVARLSVWVGLLAVAGIYVLIWRRRALLRAAPEHVALAALACVLVFTVFNKVLSPQYMCWTFPLVALVVVGRGAWQRAAGVLTLAAIALTQVEFPHLYWDVVALQRGPVTVVVARNLVLVAAALVAVLAVWRLPERTEQAV